MRLGYYIYHLYIVQIEYIVYIVYLIDDCIFIITWKLFNTNNTNKEPRVKGQNYDRLKMTEAR